MAPNKESTELRNGSVYPDTLFLPFCFSDLMTNTTSCLRFDNARKSARRNIMITIHWEIQIPVANPPIMTLNTNPIAIIITSRSATCFSQKQYKILRIK